MEEVTALPRDPSWIWGYRFAEGRGIGEQEREGKKKRERRAGQGSVWPCVFPVASAALKLRATSHSCYVITGVRPGRVLGLAGPHLRPTGISTYRFVVINIFVVNILF